MPPRKDGDRQFTDEENIVAYANARLRVHVSTSLLNYDS